MSTVKALFKYLSINNDEDHTAFPSQTPKTRRTIGNFFKTVGNKLE